MLTDKDITEQTIGAAITVRRSLGLGFLASVDEAALAVETGCQRIPFQRRKSPSFLCCVQKEAEQWLDILVMGSAVLELGARAALEFVSFTAVRFCLKATGFHSNLRLNFATVPPAINRVVRAGSVPESLSGPFLIPRFPNSYL